MARCSLFVLKVSLNNNKPNHCLASESWDMRMRRWDFLLHGSNFGRIPFLMLPVTHKSAGLEDKTRTQVYWMKVQQLNHWSTIGVNCCGWCIVVKVHIDPGNSWEKGLVPRKVI